MISQVRGKSRRVRPVTQLRQKCRCLFVQIHRLVQTDTQRYIPGVFSHIARLQRLRCLRCDPCTGLCKIRRARPPAAQRKIRRMLPARGVSPCKWHLRPDLVQHAKRVHCKLIQCNLPRLFWHMSCRRHRHRRLRICQIHHCQLNLPLSDPVSRNLADGADTHRLLYRFLPGNRIRLLPCQPRINDMAGSAVCILIIQQNRFFRRASQ